MSDTPEAAIQRVVYFFEHLQPDDVSRMADFYMADASFTDPFNEVQSVSAIQKIFADMFKTLETPQFVVTNQVQQGTQCFLIWDFLFSIPRINHGKTITIRGVTHLVLREDAGVWRIAIHRDYWDAAQELYEKLPVLGGLMRWLKKRVNS